MMMWYSCLSLCLLWVASANSFEFCPLRDISYTCDWYHGGPGPATFREGRPPTFEECVSAGLEKGKKHSDCMKPIMEAYIANKSCACNAKELVYYGFPAPAESRFEWNGYCSMRYLYADMKKASCPERAGVCYSHVREFLRLTRYDVFQTCTQQNQRESLEEVLKCIQFVKETDLSGCGGAVSSFLQNNMWPSFLSNLLCSGCPVNDIQLRCGLQFLLSGRQDYCPTLADPKGMMACIDQQLTDTPECGGVPLMNNLLEALNQTQMFKSLYEHCDLLAKAQVMFEPWGCSSESDFGRGPRSSDPDGGPTLLQVLTHNTL